MVPGCGSFDCAARFCPAHEELRGHFRPRACFNEAISLVKQPSLFQAR